MQTRFVIGIDLGTTNCALAFVDTGADGDLQCQTFAIPQVVNPGEVAVLLDQHGSPDAALGSVLAVTAGGVVRPPTGRVLEGVTLGVVAELCRGLKIPYVEDMIDFRDLPAGVTELLLAGSGFGLAAVASYDGRPFASPGPVTARLLAAFAELVTG